jgi:hypothetical protein
MIVDNVRVRVDWDADGYINEAVGVKTSTNLYPGAPYVDKAHLTPEPIQYRGWEMPEVIERIALEEGNGAAEIAVPNNASRPAAWPIYGTHPIYYQLGFKGYEPGQMRLGDVTNIIEGGHQAAYSYRIPTHTFYNNAPSTANWVVIETPADESYGKYVWSIPGHLRKDPLIPGTLEQVFGFGYSCSDSGAGLPFILGTHYSYYDGASQYTQSNVVNGATRNYVWNGPAVSEGQYRLIIPVFPAVLPDGTQYKAEVVVYGNNGPAGSPNYGRTFIDKWSETVTYNTLVMRGQAWQILSRDITVPSGVTQIAFELRLSIVSGTGSGATNFCVGNIRLLAGTTESTRATFSERSWDSALALRDDQFIMKLNATKAYRFEFDLAFRSSATRHARLKLIEVHATTKVQTVLDTRTYSGSDVSVRPAYEIASAAYDRFIYVEIVWYETLTTVYATDVAFEIRSLLLKEGVTTTTYSGGALSGYEDITDRVLSFATSSGKSSFEVSIAEDGQATIEVNNQDGFFSPANTDSPIYAGLSEGARVWIDYNNGTSWLPLWSGWLHSIEVEPGRNKRATLIARQGVEQLRGNTVRVNKANLRIDEVIAELVVNSLWTPPRTGGKRFNRQARRDTRIYSTDDVFSQLDRGEYYLSSTLIAAAASKGGADLLGAAVQSENMHLFVDRSGKLKLLSRNQWNAPDLTAPVITLDSEAIQAEYNTSVETINQVTVSIGGEQQQKPKEIIWSLRSPVKLNAKQIWTLEMTAQKTEGQRLALEPLDPSDLSVSVYKSKPSLDRKTPSAEGTDTPLYKNVTVSVIENDGRVYFKFENRNNIVVWVDAALEGRPVETEDNITYTYTDQDSVARSGVRAENISNKFIRSSGQAARFAWSYLRRKALIGGEFTSITVLKNIDMTWTVGKQIIIKESSTGETVGLRHVIIGEDFSTDSGALTVTYRLARLFQPKVGTYATYTRHYTGPTPFGSPIVNFIDRDEARVYLQDGIETVRYNTDGMDTALLWKRRIADGAFYFNPTSDQFVELDGRLMQRARLLDAANYGTARQDFTTLGINRHAVRPYQSSMVRLTGVGASGLVPMSAIQNDDRFQAAISSGAKSWGVIPVVPRELYQYLMGFVYTEATSELVNITPLASGATWGPSMTVWDNICSSWSSHTSAAVDSINTTTNVENHSVAFQAQEVTAGAPTSVPDVRAVGFAMSAPNAAARPEGLVVYERLVRMSRRDAKRSIRTTDGLQVYATAFLRGLNTRTSTYTLQVYSGQTGALLGSSSQPVSGGSLTKLSVVVPANHTFIWARIVTSTSAFGGIPQDVFVVAHGFTDFDPATPAEMYQPSGLINRLY